MSARSSASKPGGMGLVGLVLCLFFLDWSRWPLEVAVEFGGCFLRPARLRPGQSWNWVVLVRAASRVLRTGENRHAWW